MLGNQNIMAFVATADAGKARPFYEEVLGLKVKSVDQYGIMFDANGIYLRMSAVPNYKPAPYSVLSWTVGDIRAMIAGLSGKGVKFEIFPGIGQDEVGVWTAPDGTKVAWFKDTDGNMLSLTQIAG
ncbi:MAG: VOC family protein [Bacteroidetes bacterium]|nr:VOC family protein [Bacteroidota bacterium]